MNLREAPNSFFNFEIPDNIKIKVLLPIESNCASRLSTSMHWSITKRVVDLDKTPKSKRWNHNNRIYYCNSVDDDYLDDELDYIRQNGGDWIDD